MPPGRGAVRPPPGCAPAALRLRLGRPPVAPRSAPGRPPVALRSGATDAAAGICGYV